MNCLKCGRTVADGELLCPACSGQESHPEPEVKIHIHVHHRETPDSAECPVALPRKKKPRLRRWLVVSCVVNVLLVGLFSLQLLRARQLRGDFMQAQSQAQAAEAVAEENRAEVEAAREMLDRAEVDLAQKDAVITAYAEFTGISMEQLP